MTKNEKKFINQLLNDVQYSVTQVDNTDIQELEQLFKMTYLTFKESERQTESKHLANDETRHNA